MQNNLRNYAKIFASLHEQLEKRSTSIFIITTMSAFK